MCVCVCVDLCCQEEMSVAALQGAVDILEGTAQRRPFQFVVKWIGDAQSTYLRACMFSCLVQHNNMQSIQDEP